MIDLKEWEQQEKIGELWNAQNVAIEKYLGENNG
tara:strand:- start:334 stop:435 length:102 start_codon:yes stop_codon:yes gene_type:complete